MTGGGGALNHHSLLRDSSSDPGRSMSTGWTVGRVGTYVWVDARTRPDVRATARAGGARRRAQARRRARSPTWSAEYSPSTLGVARMYVSSRAVAEEVVQEAWLGVISGLDRFEGRASLKTWILRIVTNIAKTRGEREGRSIPFTAVVGREGDDEATVDPDRFLETGRLAGHWTSAPRRWSELPRSSAGSRDSWHRRSRYRGSSGGATDGDHSPRRRGAEL